MVVISTIILLVSVLIVIIFHIIMIRKVNFVLQQTGGIINTKEDLNLVKNTINFSMKLAIYYIIFFIIFIIIIAVLFFNGMASHSVIILFLFGFLTLIIGLIGKRTENKIRTMRVNKENPELCKRFKKYLKEWGEARLQLSE